MALQEIKKRIDLLKAQLDELRPLSNEQEQRVMQKFRLDWNYHSNNLEGNSLSFGETKALIMYGITAQGKPLKDHIEVQGHNEALLYIQEVVKQERPLTEAFIREVHEIILKEPYEVDAITPDGQPTKRYITIGKYKTVPNHVKTKTGEIFYFASPEETPALMHDLMNWYDIHFKSTEVDPFWLASMFHYKFIRIHPFDDGNGRLSRIFMNFILMQKGYPPVIIKTEDKQNYFSALRQADADDLESFVAYIGNQLIHSLDLMVRAAKGEDISDPNDLDKQIALLELQLKNGKKAELSRSEDVILTLYIDSIQPLLQQLEETLLKFKKFFLEAENIYTINHRDRLTSVDQITKRLYNPLDGTTDSDGLTYLMVNYGLREFKMNGTNIFSEYAHLEFQFDVLKYKITSKEFLSEAVEKLYSEPLSDVEIRSISNSLGNHIMKRIHEQTK